MASEIGHAYVSIIPSTQGFGRNLQKDVQPDARQAGKATGAVMGGAMGAAAGGSLAKAGLIGAAAAAVALPFSAAISKAAEFDKTIRTVGAASGASGAELKELSNLALKMGADTTFSASAAADAMLSLSKGGLTPAQIKAGALKDTLLLAAAGSLELGTAADYMVQGLTTFGLAADQGGQVAAALAGGANASTASVESIGQALSQVGPGAVNAGLSIQETVAALAAFDNAGIKGSDAGTSLKTMLTRLVPQTEGAAQAMRDLGLDFTDAEGKFLPIANIAGELQKALGGLSEEAKTRALSEIFGADAARAASVLATTGAAGINKLVAATSDAGAAARLAAVGTGGYAGALEQFKGSVETAQISLGTRFLPVASKALLAMTDFINGLGPAGTAIRTNFIAPILEARTPIIAVGLTVGTFTLIVKASSIAMFGAALASKAWAAATYGVAFAANTARFAVLLLNAAFLANPIGLVVAALAALGVGLTYAYRNSETFRNIVNGVWNTIKIGALEMVRVVIAGLRAIVPVFLGVASALVGAGAKAFGWIPGIGEKLAGAQASLATFKTGALATLDAVGAKAAQTQAGLLAASSTAGPAVARRGVPVAPANPRQGDGSSTVYQLNGPVVASDPMRLQRELEQKRRLQQLALP